MSKDPNSKVESIKDDNEEIIDWELDEDVKEYLKEFEGKYKLVPKYKKIKCILTKHEFPATLIKVKEHFDGKKYKMSIQYANDFTKYEPHIIPHSKDNKKLYCLVTKIELNKIPEELEKHVNGRQFKFKKEIYDQMMEEQKEREEKKREKHERWEQRQKEFNANEDYENYEKRMNGINDFSEGDDDRDDDSFGDSFGSDDGDNADSYEDQVPIFRGKKKPPTPKSSKKKGKPEEVFTIKSKKALERENSNKKENKKIDDTPPVTIKSKKALERENLNKENLPAKKIEKANNEETAEISLTRKKSIFQKDSSKRKNKGKQNNKKKKLQRN